MYLNVHSYYSLRYGTASVEHLVGAALYYGIGRMALTDINNTTGSIEFAKACFEAGIQPVVGIEFHSDKGLLYIGLARNNHGFMQLNGFLTHHQLHHTDLPVTAPHLEDVYWIYPLTRDMVLPDSPNVYAGVSVSQLNKLWMRQLPPGRLVAWDPVTFLRPRDFEVHQYLRAVDKNTLLSKLEPSDTAEADALLRPPLLAVKRFEGFPYLIDNANKLLERCDFKFDFKTSKNKRTFTGCAEDDRQLLEKLSIEGMQYRYGKNNKVAMSRVRHELDIIDKLGFASYFLITWDIVRYSLSRGFYHVGRGSGANSVVAFCLKITDVDPIELDLYFERFLNPKRTSPPDFDIDYSWKERDDVLDYIFKRYGHQHTALLGTMSTFKDRSIVRELGKVVGLPKEEIDMLVKYPDKEPKRDSLARKVYEIGNYIQSMPNQRSIHAGGVLIADQPISAYTALDLPPKGFPTVQWDMYTAEDIGFEKFDILSQRGIGHIKEAVELVRANQKIAVDFHDVERFKKDPKVKKQLKAGDTIGCFYIESPAMRGLLKKLRCDNYISLVAASSIIRPGVARSGMMKQYIYNFHHPSKVRYLHPVMEAQLKETYGVMVYQEDVLKVCHHFAGLDLADADVLRRAMSGKYRSKKEFRRIVDKFFENCKARGYPDALTNEVWRQVESFAGYSFSKAHSASFAVESFQSLYMKAHFPMEFMVAVINNFGGFYKTWVYVHELKKTGALVHLPCVNESDYTTNIKGTSCWLGFVHIAGLEQETALHIIDERRLGGPYLSLEDFVARTGIALPQLLLLIKVGALRFTGVGKKQLLWKSHGMLGMLKTKPVMVTASVFPVTEKHYHLPELRQHPLEDAFDEIELLGFPVSLSLFDLLQTSYRGMEAENLIQHVGKRIRTVGSLVTWKPVHTIKKQLMGFGTFLDHKGNFFDTTHFPDSMARYPFKGGGCYLVQGKVVEEFGFPSIEVEQMVKLPTLSDPRY